MHIPPERIDQLCDLLIEIALPHLVQFRGVAALTEANPEAYNPG